jgi:Dolichyl-phosphate-mannose-protein mannosyltransferase
LLAFGAILMASNRWFTPVDDEVAIIDVAATPALATMKLFLSGGRQHAHPPLSDPVLHEWLPLSDGNIHLLRVPSIIFYLLGAWFLPQAARRMAGERARIYTLMLLLLWPFGFHFGRLAGWYSFTFLLVALLTLAYLRYVEHPSPRNWMPVVLCALALAYTNYYGWAVLGCLGLDLLVRFKWSARTWLQLVASAALLMVASAPIMRALVMEVRGGADQVPLGSAIATGVYNLYCLFVSESVAPWFWAPGIAAGVAIVVTLLLIFVYGETPARRFLLYFAALLAAMTFLQIGSTKRLMMISPWLILSIGTTLATMTLAPARRLLAGMLVLAGAIGWFGIFSRNLYAAPHWVEPWDQLARQAAEIIGNGGTVIGNNPSFFFYLTYLLPSTNPTTNRYYAGLLPTSLHAPNIYTPQQWISAGAPVKQTVAVVDGLSYWVPGPSMDEIRASLSARCTQVSEEDLARDTGAKWKQEYQPSSGQREWRIQVVTYRCAPQ